MKRPSILGTSGGPGPVLFARDGVLVMSRVYSVGVPSSMWFALRPAMFNTVFVPQLLLTCKSGYRIVRLPFSKTSIIPGAPPGPEKRYDSYRYRGPGI